MTTTSTSTAIDWQAAEEIAARLGARTRALVAGRDPDAVIEWARRMGREHQGPAANSYLELAVLLEPELEPVEPEPDPEPAGDDQEEEPDDAA